MTETSLTVGIKSILQFKF